VYRDLDWWWPCSDRPNATVASAILNQTGSTLTASVHTTCVDAWFDGRIDGHQLSGTVRLNGSGLGLGSATGSATDSSVVLSIPYFESPCPGGPCQGEGFDVHLHR